MCHAAGTWEAHLHGAHLSVVAHVGALRRVRRPLGNLTIGRLRGDVVQIFLNKLLLL
jgi:hypothetical protein